MSVRKEVLAENVSVILGDSRLVLPTLGNMDAAVTDPPYGIGADKAAAKNRGKWGWTYFGESNWDDSRPPASLFYMLREITKHQIIWGGNYFTDLLPPTMQWLVWDKGQRDFSLADFEMAWSSQNCAARVFSYPRARALADGKEHPTQKPIAVMEWCLSLLPKEVKTIVDPFCGSGTTGVAAVRRGLSFTGIEVEPRYFDIACRRISDELARPRLFEDAPTPAQQEALL